MSYRGHDLDLRVPGGSKAASLYASAHPQSRAGSIWVDDVVLATANHAYDIALAHRSAEVRLEHLLNAATRIDAAARQLEERGYNITILRTVTSEQIAQSAPVPMLSARFSPKTSAEIEEVLQLASRRAALRQSPATINDILTVLIDMKRDIPGFETSRPSMEQWSLRDPVQPRYATEYRYVAVDEPPREWMRGAAPGYYVSPPPRPEPYMPMQDSIQNARLDAIERMMRELTQTIGADRAQINQIAAELQRFDMRRREERYVPEPVVVQARVPEAAGYGPVTLERLAAVERNVDAKFSELARTWALLGERLSSIEQTLSKPRGEGSGAVPAGLTERLRALEGLEQRLGEIDRTMTVMSDRMVALERHMSNRVATAGGTVDIGPLKDLVADLERKMAAVPRQTVDLAPLLERINGIERALATRPVGSSIDLKPLFDRLDTIERKAGQVSIDGTVDLGPLSERIGERLKNIEETVAAQRSSFAHFTASIGNEVRQLVANARQTPANPEQMRAVFGEQIQTISTLLDRQPSQLAGAIAQPLMQRIAQIGAQVDARQADSDRAFGAIAERLSALERSMSTWSQQVAETSVTHERDIREVHDALVRLNTNQQTLASSMDQWRLDLTGDMGEIANRISAMETHAQRPMAVLERMATSMDALQQTAFKRDENKSRFRHWLMGTDDWYGASWEANGRAAKAVERVGQKAADNTRGGVRPPPAPAVPTLKRDA